MLLQLLDLGVELLHGGRVVSTHPLEAIRKIATQLGMFVQGVSACPCLRRRAGLIDADESDGHADGLLQIAPEVITHGGKSSRRAALLPGGADVRERIVRLRSRDGAEADERMAGGEFLLGDGGFVERKFHVRRAGANPHVAHEDVLAFDSVLALHDERRRRGAGLERAELHLPAAQWTGQLSERSDAHLLSLKLDRDQLALVRPTPESQRQFALKHHVVGENSGQPHVRARGGRP